MSRREDQQHDRQPAPGSGNRNMGQIRDSRHPFDDHRTTRDQYGEVHDHHRDDRGQADQHNTQGASRNYGNMGSYGGAQGFGSTRGGYGHPQQNHSGFDANSGHGQQDRSRPSENRQIYGAYWDRNSFNENDQDRFSRQHRSQHQERNRYNDSDQDRQDDSRYEIYDTHQRQYNTGSYNNDMRVTPSHNYNRDLDDAPGGQRHYGSHQRPKNRQGDGNDQDRRYTADFQEGNIPAPRSDGYDGYRGYPDDVRDKRYDPRSGESRRHENRNDHRQHTDNRRDDGNPQRRGGYDANNQRPNERYRNR